MNPSVSDLRSIPLLSGLNENTLDELVKSGSFIDFPEGAYILMEGDTAEAAYFILEGQVKIFRTGIDGRDQVIALQNVGEAFNTVPPLLADPRNHSNAQSLTKVRVFKIPSVSYLSILQRFPDFTFALLSNFSTRLAKLTDLVENLALHSVRGRLARFLIIQADRDQLDAHWTQEEIAAQLGTVRDVIGRTFRAFIDEGIIRKERQRILLLDRDRLEKEAQS